MAQNEKPPATGAGGNSLDPCAAAPGGPTLQPPNATAPRTPAGGLAARDHETILLALRLAADFLGSLIEGETLDGTRIAPRHPLRLAIERWQRQRKRIAELEARLAGCWPKEF